MSSAAPHPTHARPAARDASARALTGRQMAMLDRLAEIGMEIAEDAGRMSRSLAEGAPQAADPGLTYSRAARAVRLTLFLQSRLTEGLAALDQARTKARAVDAARLRDRIHRRVEGVCEAEGADADEVEQLSSCAWERLAETEDDDLLDLPIEEVVARICQDLGLSPAWAAAFAAPGRAGPDQAGDPPSEPPPLAPPPAAGRPGPTGADPDPGPESPGPVAAVQTRAHAPPSRA